MSYCSVRHQQIDWHQHKLSCGKKQPIQSKPDTGALVKETGALTLKKASEQQVFGGKDAQAVRRSVGAAPWVAQGISYKEWLAS